MARDQELMELPSGVWTKLNNADITRISMQVKVGAMELRIGGNEIPSISLTGWTYEKGDGFIQKPLSEISEAGGTSAYGRPAKNGVTTMVQIDHA